MMMDVIFITFVTAMLMVTFLQEDIAALLRNEKFQFLPSFSESQFAEVEFPEVIITANFGGF